MTKISLTATYQISIYISRIVTLLFIWSVSALAKNNCDADFSQINPINLTLTEISDVEPMAFQSRISDPELRDGGTGGTGNQESGENVAKSLVSEGGVGGTGIIGIITGFASICVNGAEIHYDASTFISMDGRPSTAHDLAVGQVIAARTFDTGPEFKARNIAIIHAVVGPIYNFNSEIQEIRVLDQLIKISPLKGNGDFSHFATDEWVQVSGHRLSDGTIIATHIKSVPPQSVDAKITGYVTKIDADNFEVNGTRIDYDTKLFPIVITHGSEIRVVGQWDGTRLKAQHIHMEPTRQSIENAAKIVIEGYIHAFDDKSLSLNNQMIIVAPNLQETDNEKIDFKQDQLIQISGRLDADQHIIAEHVELKQESLPILPYEKNESNKSNLKKEINSNQIPTGRIHEDEYLENSLG
jgi:hypothetical protein